MSGAFFLDTNVLLYASLQPDARSETARALLARRGTISVQVLNEFAHVAARKLHRTSPEITRALAAIHVLCLPARPLTLATHAAGLSIANRPAISSTTRSYRRGAGGPLRYPCSPKICTTGR
jgi:predicted nucleic acid-binding protein